MTEDSSSNEREIELISKNVCGKRKGVQKKKPTDAVFESSVETAVNCLYCFFLPHFFLIVVFGRTAKSFLANVLSLAIQEACDQVRNHSININKFA